VHVAPGKKQTAPASHALRQPETGMVSAGCNYVAVLRVVACPCTSMSGCGCRGAAMLLMKYPGHSNSVGVAVAARG